MLEFVFWYLLSFDFDPQHLTFNGDAAIIFIRVLFLLYGFVSEIERLTGYTGSL